MAKRKIWITWENQRRNRELSRSLGARLYELDYIDRIENRIIKYLSGLRKSFPIYAKEKPGIVFCQNPSLILCLFNVALKGLLKFHLIVDAHNAGLLPAEGHSKPLLFLSRFLQQHADLTIVTNNALRSLVRKNGGKAFVLPDKIPDIPIITKKPLKGKYNILFICSYGEDEPYDIVFDAAQRLDREICIYVTGNYSKRGIDPKSLPPNVLLMGYVSEKDYIEMLNSVDGTIDLTTRENCLVCGAYESIAVGKPMILSKTSALMEYFNKGAIYVDHTVTDMECAIREMLKRKEQLSAQIICLKKERDRQWVEIKERLERIIHAWS